MQTADPFMKKLRETCPNFEATILPAIMESGGLTAAEDFRQFDHIDVLNKQGKSKEVSTLHFLSKLHLFFLSLVRKKESDVSYMVYFCSYGIRLSVF